MERLKTLPEGQYGAAFKRLAGRIRARQAEIVKSVPNNPERYSQFWSSGSRGKG